MTTWRIVLADGRVLEVRVLRVPEHLDARGRTEARTLLDGVAPYLWWSICGELAAVTGLACALARDGGVSVGAVLAPGQPTPAEAVAQDRARLIAQVEELRIQYETALCGGYVMDRIAATLREDPEPERDATAPF